MGSQIEFQTADGEHMAYMTLEENTPEPGEESFMWPEFTDIAPGHDEAWWLDLIGNLIVLDEDGNPLTWEDPEYLNRMVLEFRPGSITALFV